MATNHKIISACLVDFVVAVGCFALLVVTSPAVPFVWDEPNAVIRAERFEKWLTLWAVPDESVGRPWNPSTIHELCPYTTQIEGHPSFYGTVIAVGHLAGRQFLSPPESYRLGPMLLFSIATAAMFHRLGSYYGRSTAVLGVIFLVTMPRVFAHAHFAACDGPLTACWVMTWTAFDWARRSKSLWAPMLWGVLLGLTIGCKFTGLLAITTFISWGVIYRDQTAIRVCSLGICVALLTFVDINPGLWNDPLNGLHDFFALNLGRARNGLNISTQFFGESFDLNHPLPWYNTLAWIGLTTPPGTLVFALIGIVHVIRHRKCQPNGILLLLNWAVLVIVRALPYAPPHDAERLWLPSFAFLAALAAVGATSILYWARSQAPSWHIQASQTVVWLAMASAAAETGWYAPQWLSYYSPVAGGLRGATRLGMEPAYWWDGLDREVLAWLCRNSSTNDLVYCDVSLEFEELTSRDGKLPFKFSRNTPERCRWYIVQNRTSAMNDVDRKLIAEERPVFVKTIRDENSGFGPWRLDVPVVFIFSRDQFNRANPVNPQ